ncbi:MAG: hypothetical protein AAFQ87_20450, partial [Bacteroidota bacterium]
MIAKHKLPLSIGLSACLLLLSLFGLLYFNAPRRGTPFNEAFNDYLSAYTAGEISRQHPIKVRFAERQVDSDKVGIPLERVPFSFSPSIRGIAQWEDERTLIFVPAEDLPSGQRFYAALDMETIISDIKPDLDRFEFQFATKRQHLEVEFASFERVNDRDSKLSGIIRTADFVAEEEVEEIFRAELDGDKLAVNWTHDPQQKSHSFVIPTVSRSEEAREVEITWNARPLGIEEFGRKALTLPPLGVFSAIATYTYDNPQSHIVVEFSEPLDHEQDLKGLVRLEKSSVKINKRLPSIEVFT